MAEKYVVKTFELICKGGRKGVYSRIYLVPKCYYENFGFDAIKELIQNARDFNAYLVAYKFGKLETKMSVLGKHFKEIKNIEFKSMVDTSDWFIDEIFDKTNIKTLDRRVDPIILLISDTKYLDYRIKYYIDLLQRGYTEEEAIKLIF